MERSWLKAFLLVAGLIAFGSGMYVLGLNAGARTEIAQSAAPIAALSAQNPAPFQEVIPLPGLENQQGQGQGECQPMILFYYQGQLFQLMPGPQDQQGQPGSPPEFFPLQPYRGPAIPGLPFGPQAPQRFAPPPGFQPVQPRF